MRLLFTLLFAFALLSVFQAFALRRFSLHPTLHRLNSLTSRRSHSVIHDRTYSCLDYQVIIDELKSHSKTIMGAQLCEQVSASSSNEANMNYAMVDQISYQLEYLPLRSKLDVWKVISGIENNASPPDKSDLVRFSSDIEHIEELHDFFKSTPEKFTLFRHITEYLALPAEVSATFAGSFNHELNLSIDKYPAIRVLQGKIEALRASITKTIMSLLQLQGMQDKIADSGFVEVDGRFCVMLKNTYKRGVGIVHGSSSTGKTLYVEPHILVEPTNELKRLLAQLREEENRIYLEMCLCIAKHLEAIVVSVRAVAEIDAFAAKANLGKALRGVIPEVGSDGSIDCVDAKHPVLLLKAIKVGKSKDKSAANDALQSKLFQQMSPEDAVQAHVTPISAHSAAVVGNDFALNAAQPALVITGPNAGGKTVTLKTAGLFALMVRQGIPIPARRGARVDFFSEVMADIGDMQSVSGDISTFSGHLLVCRDILRVAHKLCYGHAASAGVECTGGIASSCNATSTVSASASMDSASSCLVLLDEVGTGTDPAQGAALAQSVLEELLHIGARVMATTHYQRIKELAVNDPRFRIAAMEFVDNLPTYRLRAGSIGESYALEAARRMELPESVLARADALLDDETRQLMGLQRRLEEETLVARTKQVEYHSKADGLTAREHKLAVEERRVAEQVQQLREQVTDHYLEDLRQKEREVERIVFSARELLAKQQAALDLAIKSKRTAHPAADAAIPALESKGMGVENGSSLEEMQAELKSRRVDTETAVIASHTSKQLQATPLALGQAVEVGTTLVVLEPGNFLKGSRGIVTHRNKGRGKVVLQIAGAEVKMERHLLGMPWGSRLSARGVDFINTGAADSELSDKERRLRKMLDEEIVDLGALWSATSNKNSARQLNRKIQGPPRSTENTVDVRQSGNFQAATRTIEEYLQNHSDNLNCVYYIHHGKLCTHKDKLRAWLVKHSSIQRCHAAELSDGGDALTVVEMRK